MADWQACCFVVAMDELAYDISHLLALDAELSGMAVPAARSTRSASPAVAKSRPLSVAEAQEALSRELMAIAEIHDALVQQYLRTRDNPFQDIGEAEERREAPPGVSATAASPRPQGLRNPE